MNPQSKIKLLTDEEIMEKYDNGWIEMGAAQREIVRIKLAMEEYPIGTEEYGYLYVAQQALHYALDPTPCAQCEHPIITALRYGKYKKRLNQQSCPPHKNEDSQDC